MNTPTPPAALDWFLEPFLAAAGLSEPPDRDTVFDGAQTLVAEHGETAPDDAAHANLWLVALTVAAYRLLRQRRPDDALTTTRSAFLDPFHDWVHDSVRRELDAAEEPLEVLRSSSKEREAGFFGPTFRFDRPQDDEHGYIAVVRGCYYRELLIAAGAPELLPTFCDFDTAWMSAADPERHGLRVERPTTFGYGGDSCWFVMTRLAEPARP